MPISSLAVVGFLSLPVNVQAQGRMQLEVHPQGEEVPENLLRIELRFSKPLLTPFDVSHIRLFDGQGQVIPNAFLDLTLPSADGRRVAVLFDPGRVKSGVGPNIAQGRALQAGSVVQLVVDDPSLMQPAVKVWTVTPPDTDPPQPGLWHFDVPRVNSRDALTVQLDQPISSAAQGFIAISDASHNRVAGSANLGKDDAVWRFTPLHAWRPGSYAVVTHPDLEDPAGNRACAAFERMDGSKAPCEAGQTLPFKVTYAARRVKPAGW